VTKKLGQKKFPVSDENSTLLKFRKFGVIPFAVSYWVSPSVLNDSQRRMG